MGDPVLRRKPVADAAAGERGSRTQRRILEAALGTFGDHGYVACSVSDIAERAELSRAAFYQYFAGKEEVYLHLSGEVARLLGDSIDVLEPVTGDAQGWAALRAWLVRQFEVHASHEPVFHAFDAAARVDSSVASGSELWLEKSLAGLRTRFAQSDLPPRLLTPVIRLLWDATNNTHYLMSSLNPIGGGGVTRAVDSLTDVVHRTLFGSIDGVNIHTSSGGLRLGPGRAGSAGSIGAGSNASRISRQRDPAEAEVVSVGRASKLTNPARQTLDALKVSARQVFEARGYHDTSVREVVESAGVSRAAFYRYFESKDHLARVLVLDAVEALTEPLGNLPATANGAPPKQEEMRAWLEGYRDVRSRDGVMIDVWVDAAVQDYDLRRSATPAMGLSTRLLKDFLAGRDFGDLDTDALIFLALLRSLRTPPPRLQTEAAVTVVERGFFGALS
jgi:AcrR family transcriptional regulator